MPKRSACPPISLLLFSLVAATPVMAQPQGGAPALAHDLQPGDHMVFGATAHTLPAGRGYFQITEMALPRFDVGITDRITFGAGTLAFYPRAVFVTPKVQVYRGSHTAAAIGLVHMSTGADFSGGVVYGVITKDTGDTSLTAGLGMVYGRYNDKEGDHRGRHAVVLVGAEIRRSAHHSVLLEGYAFGPAGVATIAGRHTWTRFSLDYGASFFVSSEFVPIPMPIINLTWGF